MTQLVFIISLPRSGSTLLQKMLTANEEVASSAEPWILLPFWSMRNIDSSRCIYSHETCVNAVEDFIASMPTGEAVFNRAVREFAMSFYKEAANGAPVFVDKTPRYYLMIPELRKIFPEAKFIYLTRNPISVIASICETFNKGRLLYDQFYVDWFEGHRLMAKAIEEGGENTRVVSYESLVESPNLVITDLCAWLNLSYSEEMLISYKSSKFSGRMGDPMGIDQYVKVSKDSLDKWTEFLNSKYKRKIIAKMVQKLSGADLMVLGYAKEDLIKDLYTMPVAIKFDVKGRFWSLINSLALYFDYRYAQARIRAFKKIKDLVMDSIEQKNNAGISITGVLYTLFLFFSFWLLMDPFYTGFDAFRVTRDVGMFKYTGLFFGLSFVFFAYIGIFFYGDKNQQQGINITLKKNVLIFIFALVIIVGSLYARFL